MKECTNENEKNLAEPCSPTKSDENKETLPPWTPTSNFKLLLKAISPDLKNRDIFDNDCTNKNKSLSGEYGEIQDKKAKLEVYGRKEKSLGVLCQKFLSIYPPFPPANTEICLKDAADRLGVGRRRVYDIINVMESIELTTRMAKNKYLWLGKNHLSSAINKLKKQALDEGLDKKLEKFWNVEKMFDLKKESETKADPLDPAENLPLNFGADDTRKSLSALSQKFLMMFLVSKNHILHLEMGAKVLLDDPYVEKNDTSKFKTMIRRLYDIANIMTTLELITKIQTNEVKHRKPFYKYIGPLSDDLSITTRDMNLQAKEMKCSRSLQKCLSFDQICEAASAARNSLKGVISQASLESVAESCSSEGKYDGDLRWSDSIAKVEIGSKNGGLVKEVTGLPAVNISLRKIPLFRLNSTTGNIQATNGISKTGLHNIRFIPYRSCTLKRFCDEDEDDNSLFPKKVVKLIIKKDICKVLPS